MLKWGRSSEEVGALKEGDSKLSVAKINTKLSQESSLNSFCQQQNSDFLHRRSCELLWRPSPDCPHKGLRFTSLWL